MKARNVTLFSILGVVVFLFSLVLSSSALADSAVKEGDPAGGDLDGTYPNPTIRDGVIKSCRIKFTQLPPTTLPVPLTIAVETTILSLTLTSETGENIKLDSMAGVHIRTLSTASHYSYEIDYSLYRDGTLIADSVERGAADQTGMTDINLSPDLTWVDAPTGGSHTYEIKVLYAGTGLDTVDVRLSQSLNAPICDD